MLRTLSLFAASLIAACAAVAATPEPTADAVRAMLDDERYRSWSLFPGTSEKITGTRPHDSLRTVYVNETAERALAENVKPLPPGSVIVKDSFDANGTPTVVAVMMKVPGYDPNGGDWYWLEYRVGGAALYEGRSPVCKGCHAAAKERDDWVLTDIR